MYGLKHRPKRLTVGNAFQLAPTFRSPAFGRCSGCLRKASHASEPVYSAARTVSKCYLMLKLGRGRHNADFGELAPTKYGLPLSLFKRVDLYWSKAFRSKAVVGGVSVTLISPKIGTRISHLAQLRRRLGNSPKPVWV